jgi:hypothetical protein
MNITERIERCRKSLQDLTTELAVEQAAMNKLNESVKETFGKELTIEQAKIEQEKLEKQLGVLNGELEDVVLKIEKALSGMQ